MVDDNFNFINSQIDDIIKNIQYNSKKSKLNVIEPKIYDKTTKNETCRFLTYDFGEKTEDNYNSSVRIKCCGDECNMEIDMITNKEDYQTKDELRQMFHIPNCTITEQHPHKNTTHNHVLCINNIEHIKSRLQRVNELVTKNSIEG